MDFEGKYNTKSPAVKRLMREACELKESTEEYCAHPVDDNLFEWHFTVQGPPGTEFEGGLYHGRIILPTEYPMKPPNIILLTILINGQASATALSDCQVRGVCVNSDGIHSIVHNISQGQSKDPPKPGVYTKRNCDNIKKPNGRFETNKKICLSISGHHPETWQPSWSIRTALLALIAFMPTPSNGTIGAIDYTPEERQILARKSQCWECAACGKLSNILSKNPSGKPVTKDESEFIQNVVFKAEELLNGANNVSEYNRVEHENTLSTNETQQDQPQPPLEASSLDSFTNIIIGLILAAIGFIIYRRLFLL